ncbi:GNAT family N-acetyltransferase [Paracoccus aminophilus]|uniref:Acetyltransferase n=1 Tax=Paracoccus aminophilus JCM 7686 TaxID=1367847 RepID=S5XYW5_PARAH|nr:GNAT family N-acetyltransferase [Paracoccus aminophilus]AGT08630.1 acetyltransferase [Paracoccus aminophilus JCM 7686]
MTTTDSGLAVHRESPLGDDLVLLFQRHTADMHADTPPESIHMMPREALVAPGIDFFVLRDHGRPVAMGAIKRIDDSHAEIKSMHVLTEERGHGHSRRLLDAVIGHARAAGYQRISLETGPQPIFAAARGLYHRAGFAECGPFEGYEADPFSVFMTLQLTS